MPKRSPQENVHHKAFWTSENIESRETNKYNIGTFAKNNIKRGELLIIQGGYVITLKDEEQLPDEYNDNGIQITEELVLSNCEAAEIGGINHVNHSCDANAGFAGQIFMVAIRDIMKGEEICIDYAMTLHHSKHASPYNMECLCGSKSCRGVVTDNDWTIPALQRRYDGHFQYYLQQKINRLKETTRKRPSP